MLSTNLRNCFRPPIPEIEEAALLLDAAVSAHNDGRHDLASELLRRADNKAVWDWTASIWGSNSPYTLYRPVADAPPSLPKEHRAKPRDATRETKMLLHDRDGYYCRFCGIPVIRSEIRMKIQKLYPEAVPWGTRNNLQHAAFQALWAQYDHLIPHARGGTSELDNLVLTCAACNYGRGNFTLAEVGLIDPMAREPRRGAWDGLERFRPVT
jgi:hypothetical protein